MIKTPLEETVDSLLQAKEEIDKVFGKGHAEKHPELVAAFISCVCTYETCIGAGMTEEISNSTDGLANSIDGLANSISGFSNAKNLLDQ